jgi:tetratricopeptide (TPR) repeat protein
VSVVGTGRPSGSGERPTELVLARIHLRTGSLGLARAELEAAAGGGRLDDAAVLDLAETRWRTGDLAGAGEAVEAYRTAGGEHPLAWVIAAEAAAAAGRLVEARTLAERAVEAAVGSLDALFAGMQPGVAWPSEGFPGAAAAELPASGDRAESATPATAEPEPPPVVEVPEPDVQLEAGRIALDAGGLDAAAVHLAVALRLAPDLAPAALELVPAGRSPALDLVRGDAYRLVGHELEARASFAAAAAVARRGGHEEAEPA